MKSELINIKEIKTNPLNPRIIKDDKYKKLVKSIQEFPEMLELRPLVIDENNIVLGGNMRLRVLQELKYKQVPCVRAKDLTAEQKNEFIIKDNLGYGEWDWDVLGNDWDAELLDAWGLENPNSEDFEEDTIIVPNEEEIRFYKKTYVLLSFPPKLFMTVKQALEPILNLDGMEYEQGSN